MKLKQTAQEARFTYKDIYGNNLWFAGLIGIMDVRREKNISRGMELMIRVEGAKERKEKPGCPKERKTLLKQWTEKNS